MKLSLEEQSIVDQALAIVFPACKPRKTSILSMAQRKWPDTSNSNSLPSRMKFSPSFISMPSFGYWTNYAVPKVLQRRAIAILHLSSSGPSNSAPLAWFAPTTTQQAGAPPRLKILTVQSRSEMLST